MAFSAVIERSPLVVVAILATAGVVCDRHFSPDRAIWAAVFVSGLAIWLLRVGSRVESVLGLALAITGVAAGHHHIHRNVFPPDDIGNMVTDEPKLARVRGRLVDEPTFDPPQMYDPLRSVPEAARTHLTLEVDALVDETESRPTSGFIATTLLGAQVKLHAGERVELLGWIQRPRGPDNPGERDYAAELLDQRIRATLLIRHADSNSIQVIESAASTTSALAGVRAWSRRELDASLPPGEASVAAALLLGDGSAIARDDWQKYIRTGVVHVLAVSGQHLAVLAGFAWIVLRLCGVRQRWGALAVAIGLCFYAALAGGRPPVLRAAVMVAIVSGAIVLRRTSSPGNAFAAAWISVLLVNPTDVTDAGCQFSFICVAILIWGIGRWLKEHPRDQLQKLIDEARPAWQQMLIAIWRAIALSYVVTFVLGLAVMPLSASHYHMVSPVGLLIGPPAVALASVALIAGFLQLAAALVCPPIVGMIAVVTRYSLSTLSSIVDFADKLPYGHFYVGTIPLWWLVGFYILIVIGLWRWQFRLSARLMWLLAWIVVGVSSSLYVSKPDALTVTFMAVGHGGATLIQTPDGRAILVDVGAMSGPNVTRRVVAPYLWHLGVTHLDEVFLTHGDLDHFNGLPSLMERFSVGRVNVTPSFSSKPTPGVAEVLHQLQRQKVEMRVISRDQQFSAGEVEIDVLHPPAEGPTGPENARSLVLIIRHAGHAIALTGDLDLEGRYQVMTQPRPEIDVWMAPHHGGKSANPRELAAWAHAKLVIAHNATGEARDAALNYQNAGAQFLSTWPDGAITITSRADGLWAETFRNKKRIFVAP